MKFTAYERSLQGTGASRRLRLSGKVPGIVYGAGEPQTIELDHNALYFALKKEAFHSSVLEMDLGGKVSQVLLRDFQMHPYKQIVQHIDFQRVDAKTRLRKKVPLHFEGWEHLTESGREIQRAFAAAGLEVRLRWLKPSVPQKLWPPP